MVAGRNDVCAQFEQLIGDCRRETEASCGVFSVNNEQIDMVLLNDVTEMFADNAAAGAPENIAYKKNVQMQNSHSLNKNLIFTLEQVGWKSYLICDGYKPFWRISQNDSRNLW